jgi:predicted DNA-binding transcriptional regulator YafY
MSQVSLPFAQQQRLYFIESLIQWEGSVRRQRVSEAFRVNANHISKDIAKYQELFPGNIQYSLNEKAYLPGKKFRPRLTSGDAAEYLSLLQAYADGGSADVLPASGRLPSEFLPRPARRIDNSVLRIVVQAIHNESGVLASYLSMNRERPAKKEIWPHALVNDGVRWHARALDREYGEYRDFVLQRIESAELMEDGAAPSEVDVDWNATMQVDLIPNPVMSQHQQRVVARDFGMETLDKGWIWRNRLRRCLVPYFLEAYVPERSSNDKRPPRLVLVNPTGVDGLRFGHSPVA